MGEKIDYLVPSVVAVVFLAGAIAKLFHDRHMKTFGETADALVVDCEVKGPTGGEARPHVRYFPIFRFRTNDGREIVAKLPHECSRKYAEKGLVLRVRYDVFDPENIEIVTASTGNVWYSVLMIAIGLAIGTYAVIGLLS